MIGLTELTLFLIAAFLLAITPGPGIFYVAARTLAGGKSEGIASSLGTGLGGFVHVLAGSLGISAVILASAELFTVIKLMGAGYLIWIGYRTIRTAGEHLSITESQSNGSHSPGAHRAFREGVAIEALNPKTAAFFLAFIPQFIDPTPGVAAVQFVILGSISVTLNTLVDLLVVLAASKVLQGAASRTSLLQTIRRLSGGTMIAMGIGLALIKKPAA